MAALLVNGRFLGGDPLAVGGHAGLALADGFLAPAGLGVEIQQADFQRSAAAAASRSVVKD